jgi:hypothetical protein
MTKIILSTFISCLIYTNIYSQNTFTSGGKYSISLGGSLSSSIGQIFSKNLHTGKNSLKEGVLQVVKKEKSSTIYLYEKAIRIYPNPSSSILIIELDKEMLNCSNYKLFNLIGETLKMDSVKTISTKIDLSNYAHGVYFLDINYKGKILNYKIIKN